MGDMEIEIAELSKQHKATYDFICEMGTFVLKAISRMEFDRLGTEMMKVHPDYMEIVVEADYYRQIIEHPKGKLEPEQVERAAELERVIDELGAVFKASCFVEPENMTPERLEAISNELEIPEWQQLNAMLDVLAFPRPASERDKKLAEVSLKYNLPMGDGLTAENITVQQSAALDEVAAEHEKQLWEVIGSRQ